MPLERIKVHCSREYLDPNVSSNKAILIDKISAIVSGRRKRERV